MENSERSDSTSCFSLKRKEKRQSRNINENNKYEEAEGSASRMDTSTKRESSISAQPATETLTLTKPEAPPRTSSKKEELVIENNNYDENDDRDEGEEGNGSCPYVGFDSLPDQLLRKFLMKGFYFNLMVAGEGGLGKSTLINSLFLTDVYVNKSYEYGKVMTVSKTEAIQTASFELKEGNVALDLTVIDTPGFGEDVDNTQSCNDIIQYVKDQFETYLKFETSAKRGDERDTRVHCCLYFIPPTGHGLRPADVVFMKKLHQMVNVIPIIAKADSLTANECSKFKRKIMEDIEANDIRIFTPMECETEEESSFVQRTPFAVIGSNTIVEVAGQRVRGRKYPWGTVLVENTEHCDFIPLRDVVLRTHLHDLVDVTNQVHYENFRAQRLSHRLSQRLSQRLSHVDTSTGVHVDEEPGPTDSLCILRTMKQDEFQLEEEKKLEDMQSGMKEVLDRKVMEKEQKLKDAEEKFVKRFELTMKDLEASRQELVQRLKGLEKEKDEFNWKCVEDMCEGEVNGTEEEESEDEINGIR